MKVYLSKSNACSFQTYSRVRELLETLNCEILEFSGGVYSNKDVLRSQILLIVPPDYGMRNRYLDGKIVSIGRGQYEQIKDFADQYYEKESHQKGASLSRWEPIDHETLILIVSHIDPGTGSVYVEEFKGERIVEDDWKTNWATIFDYDMQINLTNYISQRKYTNRLIRGGAKTVVGIDESGSSKTLRALSKPRLHLACVNLFK